MGFPLPRPVVLCYPDRAVHFHFSLGDKVLSKFILTITLIHWPGLLEHVLQLISGVEVTNTDIVNILASRVRCKRHAAISHLIPPDISVLDLNDGK